MVSDGKATFGKQERIVSRRLMERLFDKRNSRSVSAYPLRMVYMTCECADGPAMQVLVSVSKRHFKRAVKRNRVKRQIREAYRKNKVLLTNVLEEHVAEDRVMVAAAFIWLADEMHESRRIECQMRRLLEKAAEQLWKH